MKKIKIAAVLLFMSTLFLITACNSSATKKTEFISAPKDITAKKDYTGVVFASTKDTTCGMPLRYGIGDTLHWNNKVYGFCSTECKQAFVDKLKQEKKL